METRQEIGQETGLSRSTGNLRPGDHLCCLYHTEDERLAVIAHYLGQGLRRGEKVLCILDGSSNSSQIRRSILAFLRNFKFQVENFLDSGQLTMFSWGDTQLMPGYFDPQVLLEWFTNEAKRAQDEGYAALRICMEMGWTLKNLSGLEDLHEYEHALNTSFMPENTLVLCIYDQNRFSDELVLKVFRNHPLVYVGKELCKNFYYIPPEKLVESETPASTLYRSLDNLLVFKRSEDDLIKAKNSLEIKIAGQTTELRSVNDKLEQELIEHRRVEEALRQTTQFLELRNVQLTWILETANSLLINLDLDTLLQKIAQAAHDSLGFDVVVLGLYDLPERQVRLVAHSGLPEESEPILERANKYMTWNKLEKFLVGRFRVGRSYFIPHDQVDWEQGLLLDEKSETGKGDGAWHADDILLSPIEAQNEQVVGILSVDHPVGGKRPNIDTLHTLEVYASLAAVAIQNASLYDRLQTELGERRKAEERLQILNEELEDRVKERTANLSLVNVELMREIVEHKQTREALQRKTYQQQHLIDTARRLTESLDVASVLNRIAVGARDILDASGCTIYMLEDDQKTLAPVVAIEPEFAQEILASPLNVATSFTGQAVQERCGLIFNDANTDTSGFLIPGTPVVEEERVIVSPFIFEGKVLGAMCLNRVGKRFTQDDLAICEVFSAYGATALNNARDHEKLRQEVTERQKAEEDLRRAETRYQTLVEQIPAVTYIVSLGEALEAVYISPQLKTVLGYSEEEWLGDLSKWRQYVYSEDREQIEKASSISLTTGEPLSCEYRMFHRSGELVWIRDEAIVLRDENGKPEVLHGIFLDITERMRVEKQIQDSLKEKEVLLKEIHHRVKNNLQVVISLLNLQSEHVQDAKALEVLKESQNRVRLMALIHEKLYQSENLARIDFAEYLRSLASYLWRSYNAHERGINLEINAKGVYLGIDKAVPCGLILNELVSNALKHAFPEGRKGTVKIIVAVEETGQLRLQITDDGVGYKPKTDKKKALSLGLQLVDTLVAQLDATLEVDGTQGTTFTIRFKQPE